MCRGVAPIAIHSLRPLGSVAVSTDDYTCPKPAIVEMTDDDERRKWACCFQPCHDLLVNLGLLKPNIGMLASLPSFDSRRYQPQTDESTASPRHLAQDKASPVLPDYMLTTERPASSVDRMLIARYARKHAQTLPSAVVQECIVEQQPADHIHERQEPAEFDPEPDTLR